MRDASRAEALLSLFTTRERAESIAGDLAEERDVRGSAWFWFHVFRTTFALFTSALTSALPTTLALGALGLTLFVILAFGGFAVVALFPFLLGTAKSWVFLSLFWWSAALWTGISMVSIAPKYGMTACLALALAVESLLIASRLFFAWSHGPNVHVWALLIYTSALLAAVPIVAGGAIVRLRQST
jgi:hypothetical protein